MFTLEDLPYDYGALEPYIDEQTMRLHHGKHHQSYVDKLNAAVKGTQFEKQTITELVAGLDQVPEEIRPAVRNHGGGHLNHSMFWLMMTPNKSELEGDLLSAINSQFGSIENFKGKFAEAAQGRFGSGWAWLVKSADRIEITSTANQDSPLSENQVPILGLDVWEHAYYLKYQNKRPEYIDAWWNVVNWKEVSKRYKS